MSVFVRTISGFKNYRLFLKKDIIAFCEGGSKSVPVEEALAGTFNKSTEDSTFWRIVTDACGAGKTFHIRSIGDTSALSALAAELISSGRTNWCVLSDRDRKGFHGKLIADKRVVYTRGYSWENHVLKSDLIVKTLLTIGHFPGEKIAALKSELDGHVKSLLHALRLPLYMDISSIGSGASFFEKSERCGGLIQISSNNRVYLNRTVLRTRFRANRGKFKRNISIRLSSISHVDFVPGHVLMGLSIAFIKSHLKQSSSKSIPGDFMKAALLQRFELALMEPLFASDRRFFAAALKKI